MWRNSLASWRRWRSRSFRPAERRSCCAMRSFAVRDVAELTGWPEMLGGRVKTLHPKVHGGILFQRGKAGDRKQTAEHAIQPIDLVVVNLYPFSATAAQAGRDAGRTDREYRHRRAGDDSLGGEKFSKRGCGDRSGRLCCDRRGAAARARELSLATRLGAGAQGVRADGAIRRRDCDGTRAAERKWRRERSARSEKLPARMHVALERRQPMRYGENPHQAAALYVPAGQPASGLRGREAAAGQRAFLQQSGGPGCGVGAGERIQAAGGSDHQAQQPVRRGGAGHAA